jgi:hypothetical protein
MLASEKMDAFGMKALATATGRDLVTLYRWKRAIANGSGISDQNKLALIDATANSPAPIAWDDFRPLISAIVGVAR